MIQLVQGPVFATGTATPITISFANTPVQNNLLIAVTQSRGSTEAQNTVTGFTKITSATNGTNSWVKIFYKIAGAAESKNVVFNSPYIVNGCASIYEFSGLTTTPLDKSASTDGASGTTCSSGTTAAISQAYELIVAGFGMYSNGAVTGPSLSNGFLLSGSNSYQFVGYKIVNTAAAYESTLSWTTTRVPAGVIATFKGTALTQNLKTRVGGSWVPVVKVWTKQAGVWREGGLSTRVSGTWRTIHENPNLTY